MFCAERSAFTRRKSMRILTALLSFSVLFAAGCEKESTVTGPSVSTGPNYYRRRTG